MGKTDDITIDTYSGSDFYEIEVCDDRNAMTLITRVDREAFEEALDDVSDCLSEWIEKTLFAWLDSFYDDHEQMTEEQLNLVKHFITEARP